MAKKTSTGAVGVKLRITRGLPVAATLNCADNSGAKNLMIIAVQGVRGSLNRLPAASIGDVVLASCKKGVQKLRKKVHPAVVIRQRRAWRRPDGTFLYCEDNAGVIVLFTKAVLIAFSTIFFLSVFDLIFSRRSSSSWLKSVSTCYARYFFIRLRSSLLRCCTNTSFFMVNRMTQVLATNLDLSFRLSSISSSQKNL